MFKAFQNLKNEIATKTDLRLLLGDPKQPNSNFVNEVSFSVFGKMTIEIGEMFQVPALAFEDSPQNIVRFAGDIFVLPWRVTAMEAEGDSPLGPVKVTSFAGTNSFGVVRQKVRDNPFPAELEADVCAAFTVPEFGELHTITPVKIKADINSIPPFGVEAKHVNSGILGDVDSKPRGMIIGNSITLIGPA